MINVGFKLLGGEQWLGGMEYSRNLIDAILELKNRKINPVLFVGHGINNEIIRHYYPKNLIRRSFLFNNYNYANIFLVKIAGKIANMFGYDDYFEYIMSANRISVISHTYRETGSRFYKIISWIPDYQHLEYPEFFSKKEIAWRNNLFRNYVKVSGAIILSSNHSVGIFKKFAPGFINKIRVLHFVAAIPQSVYRVNNTDGLKKKYGFSGKFFFLPNQFWKHKNHKTVFEAVRLAKRKIKDIFLLCSGKMEDYRDTKYVPELSRYISANNLGDNIRLLGVIDRKDVYGLMRHSVSVINPSLYEGWSTTVEEAKSMGKNIILSDIPVHREQNPKEGTFFKPKNPEKLAETLISKWKNSNGGPDKTLEMKARKILPERRMEFARKYQDIVLSLFK